MEALGLGKDARRLLELTKGSHEPPAIAKARLRERLDTKLAATAILGVTGLASKTSLAQLVLPVGKAVLVSCVLVGAASVGYVSAPTLREPAATVSLARTARSSPARVGRISATASGSDQAVDPAAAIGSAVLTPLEQAPATELPREIAPPVIRESSQPTPSSVTGVHGRENVAPMPASKPERQATQPATLVTSAPEGAALTPAPLDEGAGGQLVNETRLIRQAHQAILKGEPTAALELLADHERRFASGALQQERDAARIVATCKLGRIEEARLQWTKFTAIWPGSPLIDSVRSSCHWQNAR